MNSTKKELSIQHKDEILKILKARFEKNMNRHMDILWENVLAKLETNSSKLWSLSEMELSDGEPDVVGYDKSSDEYIFYDCAKESPKGRRSLCYDRKALDARKEHKPRSSAMDMAENMGTKIMTEEQYRELQTFGPVDTKTSSWLETSAEIRSYGGAIFGDFRYNTVFIYHNGADSYYAARGFRAVLKV